MQCCELVRVFAVVSESLLQNKSTGNTRKAPKTSRVKDTDGESGWCMLQILSYNCVQKLATGNLLVIYGKMCHRKTHEEHDLSVECLVLAPDVATQMCNTTPS